MNAATPTAALSAALAEVGPFPVMPAMTLAFPVPAPNEIEVNGTPHLRNNQGNLVPLENVKPADLLEDQAARLMLFHAEELSARIKRFREHCLADIGEFIAIVLDCYGVVKGGKKGNVSLTTYDGLGMVKLKVADQIAFGTQLHAAKALIDECLAEWSSESVPALRIIVQGAFDVEKEGEVSPSKLFPLLKYEIEDPRWKRAMTAILDAIQVRGTKEYVTFYRRPRVTARWERVSIDAASA